MVDFVGLCGSGRVDEVHRDGEVSDRRTQGFAEGG